MMSRYCDVSRLKGMLLDTPNSKEILHYAGM
jgi:hypothetical protein